MSQTISGVGLLASSARQGDRAAEAALCHLLTPSLRRQARRLTHRDDVNDLVHDALIVFLDRLRRGAIHERERVAAFAASVVKNLARTRLRQNARRKRLLEAHAPLLYPHVPEEKRAVPVEIDAALASLQTRLRDILFLTYEKELTCRQIGDTLRTSEGNVRLLRHMALKELRQAAHSPGPVAATKV